MSIDSKPSRGNSVAILLGSALIAAAILWHSEGQRFMIAGDGQMAIRLDRRTGDTEVCVRRRGDVGGASGFVAPCDGTIR